MRGEKEKARGNKGPRAESNQGQLWLFSIRLDRSADRCPYWLTSWRPLRHSEAVLTSAAWTRKHNAATESYSNMFVTKIAACH